MTPYSLYYSLVPKLCLGTHFAKLCFATLGPDAKQSFAPWRPQAELGDEDARAGRGRNEGRENQRIRKEQTP